MKKEQLEKLIELASKDAGSNLTDDQLIEVANKVQEIQTILKKETEEPMTAPTVQPILAKEKAYNIRYDTETKKFILIVVEYIPGVTATTEELFATALPEVNYKLGKLFVDPLARKVYGR